MELNKDELRKLLYDRFGGNFTKMAKELNVHVAQLYRILEKGSNAGSKFFGKLMVWCSTNSLDYNDFIILPKSLTAVNG